MPDTQPNARCPRCGGAVFTLLRRCAACGWFIGWGGSDDIERELLATADPDHVATMRAALDACSLLELDDRWAPAVRSAASELADEIRSEFRKMR